MRPVWPQYFANANLFLFVISINATGLLATAVIELHSLLIHPNVQVTLLILNTGIVYIYYLHVTEDCHHLVFCMQLVPCHAHMHSNIS